MPQALEKENLFYGNHFIEIAQIQQLAQLEYLFALAKKLSEMHANHDRRLKTMLETFTVAIIFYQRSSRTFGSCLSAAQNLGADVVAVHDMTHLSSAAKGEDYRDGSMMASASWGADLIIQRHENNDSSHQIAAEMQRMNRQTLVVNAGSGTGEHPTQALLDAYTIYNRLGRLDNLHVVMVGDMLFGRTVKSLAKLLATVGEGNRITFVAPKGLEMPSEVIESLQGKVTIKQADSLEGSYDADVVYWTRVQREWFEKANQMEFYTQIKDAFVLTPDIAAKFPEKAIFMHPLPRVNEIDRAVDTDPRAVYLTEEMESGLAVRRALFAAMLLEDPLETL